MTRSRYAVNYIRYSVEELKTLVLQRGLQLPVEPYRTSALVSLLMDADRKTSFRFEELPAELRNEVYRHLLRFHETAKGLRCWTQILRATKSTNREAKDILWECNTFTVTVRTAKDSQGTGMIRRLAVSVNGSKIPEAAGTTYPLQTLWPAYLRQARHLDIVLDLPDPSEGARSRGFIGLDFSANHYLYSLCSFLQGQHVLKSLQVDMKVEKEEGNKNGTDYFRPLLSPLRLVGSLPCFTMKGAIEGMPEAIREAMHKHSSANTNEDTLRTWKRLQSRICELVELYNDFVGCDGSNAPDLERAIELINSKALFLEQHFRHWFVAFDEARDISLWNSLKELQALMEGGVLDDVREAMEEKAKKWQETMARIETGVSASFGGVTSA